MKVNESQRRNLLVWDPRPRPLQLQKHLVHPFASALQAPDPKPPTLHPAAQASPFAWQIGVVASAWKYFSTTLQHCIHILNWESTKTVSTNHINCQCSSDDKQNQKKCTQFGHDSYIPQELYETKSRFSISSPNNYSTVKTSEFPYRLWFAKLSCKLENSTKCFVYSNWAPHSPFIVVWLNLRIPYNEILLVLLLVCF